MMLTPTKEEFQANVKRLDIVIKLARFISSKKQSNYQNKQHDKKKAKAFIPNIIQKENHGGTE
jgi:hypothetical protein